VWERQALVRAARGRPAIANWGQQGRRGAAAEFRFTGPFASAQPEVGEIAGDANADGQNEIGDRRQDADQYQTRGAAVWWMSSFLAQMIVAAPRPYTH